MKVFLISVITLVLAAVLAPAAAAAPASTTLVLSCDRLVGSASATVELRPSLFDPTVLATVNLSCGTESVSGLKTDRQKVAVEAGWANVSTFAVITGAFNGGCPGGTTIPARIDCPVEGQRATLTIR